MEPYSLSAAITEARRSPASRSTTQQTALSLSPPDHCLLPRELHAAAILPSGQVLIIGGSDGANALATTDIYDPSSELVSAGPLMSTPRQNLSATVQLDGKILAAGGNNGNTNGNQDLSSAEVYDPDAGTFTTTGSLATARQGHKAFLLPHNAAILVVGGTSTVAGIEVATASAEVYYPLATGQDAAPNWNGTFAVTNSMASARSYTGGAPLSNNTPQSQNDGMLLIAGGKDQPAPLSRAANSMDLPGSKLTRSTMRRLRL